ncbi:glutathione S-transferase family protein [Hyaloraphidium curvatum]|nr:glutathione S-transferase family protein [Hyaloraphidium curvatum]
MSAPPRMPLPPTPTTPLPIPGPSVAKPTLYHCPSARSFRALWALEELGLDYDLVVMPFPPRVFEKAYLKVNPLGTIPLYLEGTTRMTESAAICEFLAARHGPTTLAVKPEEPAFGDYLNFLYQGEATLTFPQTIVLRYRFLEVGKQGRDGAADDYGTWFLARLRHAGAKLEREEYVCAGRFTMADISFAYALMLAERVGLDKGFPPAVARYWARMKERDGFKRAIAAQERGAEARGLAAKPRTYAS